MLKLWHKILISIVLIGFISWGALYLNANGQSAFDKKVVLKFPGGCTEIYLNGNLTTDKCPELAKTGKQPYDLSNLGNVTY